MPEYEFRTADGRIVTEFLPMSEAPEIGSWRTVGGVRAQRIASVPRQTDRRYEHVAHSLPPWDPRAPRHDEEGQPVFVSRKEIDEYAARSGKVYR